jgi:hypothetical protein
VYELNFIADIVEEKLVKGNLRWLANFTEIHRDFAIGDLKVPVYARGSLEEKGFLLSRLFSTLVTPKYKIHFLLCTYDNIDVKFLRRLLLSCKSKFGPDDWIFIELVQSEPIDKTVKDTIKNIADKTLGIVASSLASKDEVSSENVLGRNLRKQLKLTEAKFEPFDAIDYLKSFAIVFFLGTIMLITLQIFFLIQAANPWSLLLMLIFSVILGYPIYKTRYHLVLKLDDKGFEVSKGKKLSTQGKWTDFRDVAIYVSPKRESYLRLYSKDGTLDLPISRVGISRKDAFNAIKQLIREK